MAAPDASAQPQEFKTPLPGITMETGDLSSLSEDDARHLRALQRETEGPETRESDPDGVLKPLELPPNP